MQKKERIELMKCPIDTLTMAETVEVIDKAIQQKETIQHIVVNVAKLVYMQKNQKLFESVVSSDIINPDGLPVVWAANFLNKAIPERVSGIDLMHNLVKLAHKNKYKIHLKEGFYYGTNQEIDFIFSIFFSHTNI